MAGPCTLVQLGAAFLGVALIAPGAHFLGLFGAILGDLGDFAVTTLNILGMQRLAIPFAVWSKWLKLPVVWFRRVIAVAAWKPAQTRLRFPTRRSLRN